MKGRACGNYNNPYHKNKITESARGGPAVNNIQVSPKVKGADGCAVERWPNTSPWVKM